MKFGALLFALVASPLFGDTRIVVPAGKQIPVPVEAVLAESAVESVSTAPPSEIVGMIADENGVVCVFGDDIDVPLKAAESAFTQLSLGGEVIVKQDCETVTHVGKVLTTGSFTMSRSTKLVPHRRQDGVVISKTRHEYVFEFLDEDRPDDEQLRKIVYSFQENKTSGCTLLGEKRRSTFTFERDK